MKKLVSFLLIAVMVLSLSACGGDGNYPVTVGNIKLNGAPGTVVTLNADAADVMLNLGYSGAIAARSDECIQSTLESLPSVGAAASPDVDAIIDMGVDAVLADETLGEVYLERLRDAGITVFRLDMPQTDEEISGFYRTIGLIMGGAETGVKNAEQEYEALYKNISAAAERILGSNATYTICYLSLDGNGDLVIPKKDTFVDRLLSATGSTTVTPDGSSTVEELLISRNPAYIFYDSRAVLDKLGSSPETAELFALTQGDCYEIPLARLELIGISAALNVGEIMGVMYPQTYDPTPPEPSEPDDTPDTSDPTDPPDTSDPTDPPVDDTDLSSQYGITITEGMVIDKNSDPALITAMQQRFYDLGYMTAEPDGNFGSITRQCINDFQFLNNFIVDGIADYDFLTALFNSDAVPRN